MRKPILSLVLLTFLVVGGAILLLDPFGVASDVLGRDRGDRPQSAPNSEAERAVRVEVQKTVMDTAAEMFRTSGEIVAEDRVDLTSEVRGIVREVAVGDGARVAAGDVVVRFDDAEERASLEAAEAQRQEAEAELQRSLELAERDFAPAARVEQARAAFEAALANVATARAILEDQVVRAPFDGEIGFVAVSPGALLEPGEEIASLATTQRLSVRFSLPLNAAPQVSVGDDVRVFVPGSDALVEATVTVLAPLVESATRSVRAEAEFPERGHGLQPGAFVTVEVASAVRKQALFVPETALLWQGSNAYVFAIRDESRVQRIEVAPGVRRNGLIEIDGDGLASGDLIVTEGLQKVRDGTLVDAVGGVDDDGGPASPNPAAR